jgi:hypothetical protein
VAQNYYLSSASGPKGSFVIDQVHIVPKPPKDFVYGDSLTTNLYVVDGLGGFDPVSGQVGSGVITSLGLPGVAPIWTNSNWTRITNGWNGTIVAQDAAFGALFTSLGTNPISLELDVRITDAAGNPVTYANPIISLYNSGIVGLVTVPPTIGPSRDGLYAIPAGVDSGTVTGLALPLTPRRVYPSVRKPAGGFTMFANSSAARLRLTAFNSICQGRPIQPATSLNT